MSKKEINSNDAKLVSNWRSWHIFTADSTILDEIVAHLLPKMVSKMRYDKTIDEWFFIRYWENGPHIRLRLRGIEDELFREVGDEIRSSVQVLIDEKNHLPSVESYPSGAKFDGWHADPSMLPWFPQGTVAEVIYEPEYRRYGGPLGLEICQRLFEISSRMALKVVADTVSDRGRREVVAIFLTAAAVGAVCRDHSEVRKFLMRMRSAWESFAGDTALATDRSQRLADSLRPERSNLNATLLGDAPTNRGGLVRFWANAVESWVREIEDLDNAGRFQSPLTGVPPADAQELRSGIANILLSHIHMTNNRLGFGPAFEYQFADALLRLVDTPG
jgi:thiopeptide-type bacteriocin biosynthesis protein